MKMDVENGKGRFLNMQKNVHPITEIKVAIHSMRYQVPSGRIYRAASSIMPLCV